MKTSDLTLTDVYTSKDGTGRYVVIELGRRWDRSDFGLQFSRPAYGTFSVSHTSRHLLFLKNSYPGTVSDEKLLRLIETVRQRVADFEVVTDDPQQARQGALLLELLGGQVKLVMLNPVTLFGTVQAYVDDRAAKLAGARQTREDNASAKAANQERFQALSLAHDVSQMRLTGFNASQVTVPLELLEELLGAAK